MKILFPENIFTSMIALFLPEELRNNLNFQPASSISAALDMEKNSIGLIPALDILNHRELLVSRKYGISFEGSLCNTYIYFSENRSVKSLNITGDVSSSEVILSRILFKEVYNLEVESALSTSLKRENNNLIIAGNKNFYDDRLFGGISFSEEMIELLSLPYINYVLASQDDELIKKLEPVLFEKIPDVYDTFDKLGQYFSLSDKILGYLKQNVSSLVLELDDQDMEALNQLLLLPYFHGVIKEIIEPKTA
jgi:hypothetical protein